MVLCKYSNGRQLSQTKNLDLGPKKWLKKVLEQLRIDHAEGGSILVGGGSILPGLSS